MVKIILSVVFVGVAIASFVFYVKPTYAQLNANKALIKNYDAALSKARQVQEKINELVVKRNEMSNDDLNRLSKMVPTNVDNIQLILDIEGITKQYDMKMQKVNISQNTPNVKQGNNQPRINVGTQQDDKVKSLNLSFEVVSTYDEFIRFIVDLEHSLRIVDIVSLSVGSKKASALDTFESGMPAEDLNTEDKENNPDNSKKAYEPKYTFSIVLKTYWINK